MLKLLFFLFCALVPTAASALVNPSLQPNDFFDRHLVVVTLRVAAVDLEAKKVRFDVVEVHKGAMAAKEVHVALSGPAAEAAADELLVLDGTLVAYIGKTRNGHEDKLLFYAGSGRWQAGRLEKADDPSRWIWDQDLGLELFGTFNGMSERLAEMMADVREGRYFFPATPFASFLKVVEPGGLPGPVLGVALHDIDGDGLLDVVACCAKGDRIWMQSGPLIFTDRTRELGLADSASPSVSIGDLNGDGVSDLLLGTQAWLGEGSGKALVFTKAPLVPPSAAAALKCATLAEINGDGWPDVVVSRSGNGLAIYLNPGSKGGPFADASAAAGLDSVDAGSHGNGFFAPGDWNADGRTDLFYAVGNGLILLQGTDGRFTSLEHDIEPGLENAHGLGGSATFAPLWTRDGRDLAFSTEVGVHLLVDAKGRVRERTSVANELNETTVKQLAMIAEDLDADGNVDLFVASREAFPCKFFANRGYGSFTCPVKYKPSVFPEQLRDFGAWGLAAGDVDGDGANDLLLGGVDGRILLLVNGTLNDRALEAKPAAKAWENVLARTRILSATVSGTGSLGAAVVLADSKGRVVARHQVGSNVATGCRGPDTVNFAVREPGPMVLTVRFSDGKTRSWPVNLDIKERRVVLKVSHD